MNLNKLIKFAMNKIKGMFMVSKENPESGFSDKMLPNFKKIMLDFLTYKPLGKHDNSDNSIHQFLSKANENIDEGMENLIKKAKAEIKSRIRKKLAEFGIKILGNFLKFLIKAVVKLIPILFQLLPYIIAIILIIFIISLFPAFSNLFSFSYGFDKTAYYDNDLFQAVKNKEIMLENLYEKSSETSYYQRFADTTLDNLIELIAAPELEGSGSVNYKDKIKELQKNFTGFYSLDSRLTVHDANFKSTQDMIQANTVDSGLGASATVQGYLRDYFNKEVNFEISAQFLMQLNNKAFANYGMSENLQLIYPEIFTKPVSYIDDFNRVEAIRNLNLDGRTYSYSWEEYTYVTQRIGLDDIGKNSEDLLLHFREKDWAQYYENEHYENKKITSEMQGKINSYPSPYVWEYIVIDKDNYNFYDNSSGVNNIQIIDNNYNSEYLVLINDKTKEEVMAKFYYKILGYSENPDDPDADVSWIINGVQDTSLGGNADNYVFDGPYMSMENTANGGLDLSSKVKKSSDDLWYIIEIPEGYRLKGDVAPTILTPNGLTLEQERTINEIKVNKKYNKKPKKHVQLVNLIGKNGDIAVSSQNLINYKYYKFKTVSEAYRNKEDYINGWSEWILKDDNNNFMSEYADRNFFSAVGSRVAAFGSNFWDSIRGVDNNLEISDANKENAKMFNFIAEFPKDALNFSLYLYEKGLHKDYDENSEIWKYDYSVNNYFKTDNETLDSKEYFQKYFYFAEELILARSIDESGNVVWKDNAFTKTLWNVSNSLGYTESAGYTKTYVLGVLYDKLVKESNVDGISGDIEKILEKTSLKMSTAYLNLGTVRRVDVGNNNLDTYVESGEIVGEALNGNYRLGEASLLGTTFVNSELRNEMEIHSSKNMGTEDIEEDVEHTYSYLNSFDNIKNNVKNFFKSIFGGDKIPKEELAIEYTVTISAEEHQHLQDDYYIVDDIKSNSSNVKDVLTGNELPLELKSVRDYGLGSILNYVDSVVVEFKSGVSYEETYLAEEIGNQILEEFKDVYKNYSLSEDSSMVSEGYYPKEVKDRGSDKLVELFAQNNKKAFFVEVAKAVDSKIFEVSAEYDAVHNDPNLNGYISSANVSITDETAVDNINNINISVDIINETYSAIPINLELTGSNENILIKDFNNIKSFLESRYIFTNDEDSTFDYFGPELLNINTNGLSQLLLPKRYYRSWLFEDGLVNNSSDFKKSEKLSEKEDMVYSKTNGLRKYAKSVFELAKDNNAISSAWFQDEMDRRKKGHEAIAPNKEEYSNYLLNKSISNFVGGMSGEYKYIDEDEIKKVYLIDEVVTFAGKFMYTYKDSLLSVGNTADETTPKSILGAYATDRYVFLDSWDIKLLSERIVNVDFMLFSVEGKIYDEGEWKYISDFINDYNKRESNSLFGFMRSFDSVYTKLQDTAKATYMLAVPAVFSEEYFRSSGTKLDDLFKNHDPSKASTHSEIMDEIERYTQYIYDGFLFDESLNSVNFTDTTSGGTVGSYRTYYDLISGNKSWTASREEIERFQEFVKQNANISLSDASGDMSYDTISSSLNIDESYVYLKENIAQDDEEAQEYFDSTYEETKQEINTYINDMKNEKFNNFNTAEQWKEYVDNNYTSYTKNDFADSKNLKKRIDDFYKEYDTTEVGQDETINAIVNELIVSRADAYLVGHHNALMHSEDYYSVRDNLEVSYISDKDLGSGNFVMDAWQALKDALEALAAKVLNLVTGFEIEGTYKVETIKFSNFFLGNLTVDENSLKNYFHKYVKVLETDVNDFEKDSDYFDFDYKITINRSKEDGKGRAFINKKLIRYTLKVSDEIALSEEGGRFYSQLSSNGIIGETIKSSNIENSEITNSYTFSTTDFGELIHVSADQIMRDEFIDAYNSRVNDSEKFTKEEWYNLWQPQLKIFDNLNNKSYNNDALKEYVYGVYNNPSFEDIEKIYNGDKLTLDVQERFQDKQTRRTFFFNKVVTADKYSFINSLTKKDDNKYLKGFKLEEHLPSEPFAPDLYDKKEETIFKDKGAVINLYDASELIFPTAKYTDKEIGEGRKGLDLNVFTETLNALYKEKAKEIILSGDYGLSAETKNKDFNISGFVLVPRLTDRRDEPDIYPLYKYFAGMTKKIEPSEVYKYFEGQTYDSWKNRMTINDKSSEEDEAYFRKEKTRLSEYLETYLENFEANIPYNILADADLEVRGTAGYADLMTNYTLNASYTAEYTNLFENEANKYYWKEFLDAYDITAKDLAQLLQGIVEHSIAKAGEEAFNILINAKDSSGNLKYPDLDDSNSENINILQEAIEETISNKYAPLEVMLYNKSVGDKQLYPLPVMGIAALDNYIDEPTDELIKNNIQLSTPFNNFMFLGNFSISFKNIIEGNYNAKTFISQGSTIEEFISLYENDIYNQDNIDGIIVNLGINDILNLQDATLIETNPLRILIGKLRTTYPDANIYVHEVPNVPDYGYFDETTGEYIATKTLPSAFESFLEMNEAIITYNNKLKSGLSLFDNVEVMDVTGPYMSETTGLEEDFTVNDFYINDVLNVDGDNTNFIDYIRRNIYGQLFETIDSDYESVAPRYIGEKNTKYEKPSNSKTEPFEISLKLYENNNKDDRLNQEKSITYVGVKLYKLSRSMGDLLKGVYCYFDGKDFVRELIVVTDDNAKNLIENPEHGLWYNPTVEDISLALENLLGKDSDYKIPESDKLVELFGIEKIKNSFSFIKNIENRKKMITHSMNSGAGVFAGMQIGDSFGDILGNNADNVKKAAENNVVSGYSPIFDEYFRSISVLEYIFKVCAELSSEEIPLDPALIIATLYQESGLEEGAIQENGSGRGIAQISNNEDKETSYLDKNNKKVKVKIKYDNAMDGVNSIDYTIANLLGTIQAKSKDYEEGESMHPLMAMRAHNLPMFVTVRKEHKDEYPLTQEGDLAYIMAYEDGTTIGHELFKETMTRCYKNSKGEIVAPKAYKGMVSTLAEYQDVINNGGTLGYSDPRYSKNALKNYVEEYSTGDGIVILDSKAHNKRDYSEEIWEEQYMKYQNTGLNEYINHMDRADIDDLISSTAIYRNNNEEQHYYGYTLLDFFNDINKTDSTGENEFTGSLSDSLILNAMTYLGAHYSQGLANRPQDYIGGRLYSRISNAENISPNLLNGIGYDFTRWQYSNLYYVDGTSYNGDKYAMDCSSFATLMYMAMGYEFKGGATSTLRSGFSELWPNADITDEIRTIDDLRPGDILISTKHAMIWIGDYSNDYKGLFNRSTLRIKNEQVLKYSGEEVLSWANANVVGKKAYIHEGNFTNGDSAVSIKPAYNNILNKNNCKVYRIFKDDVNYDKGSIEAAGLPTPTIFTSTTIKNNPFLVSYMENAGILDNELAKGQFTMEDVNNAKNIVSITMGETDIETE